MSEDGESAKRLARDGREAVQYTASPHPCDRLWPQAFSRSQENSSAALSKQASGSMDMSCGFGCAP